MTLLTTAVIPLLVVAWGYFLLRRARRSLAWPMVSATIVESRVVQQGNTRSPRLAFDYAVADQHHVGRRLWVGPRSVSVSGEWANRIVARYPVGAAVWVAVDPSDPAYAVLEPGVHGLHWLVLGIGVAILAGGLIAATWVG